MATGNRDKINILSKLKEAIGLAKVKHVQSQFRYTGDASTTEFTLPNGWKPFSVYGTDGTLQLEGDADDYTVSGNIVIFAIAPSSADFVIIGERQ